MENIRFVLAAAVILILIGVIYWFGQPESFEMNGNLVEVKDRSIIIRGIFVIDSGNIQEPKDFELGIDADTKIIRVSFAIPEGEEMFNPADLPKQESLADLGIMKTDLDNAAVGLEIIKLKKDIFGRPKMAAKEIRYLVPQY